MVEIIREKVLNALSLLFWVCLFELAYWPLMRGYVWLILAVGCWWHGDYTYWPGSFTPYPDDSLLSFLNW